MDDTEDLEFEIEFFEGILAREPENVEVLAAFGHVCTAAGHVRKGLRADLALVRLRPLNPVARYNLACSYSLLGETERSLRALSRAIALGYVDREHMMADPDLENVRSTPGFDTLAARLAAEGVT